METVNADYVWPKSITSFSSRFKSLTPVQKLFQNVATKISFTYQTFRKATAVSEAIKVQPILRLWITLNSD